MLNCLDFQCVVEVGDAISLLPLMDMYLIPKFILAENTRRVARNLHHENRDNDTTLIKQVDVLIPEVIQVRASN